MLGPYSYATLGYDAPDAQGPLVEEPCCPDHGCDPAECTREHDDAPLCEICERAVSAEDIAASIEHGHAVCESCARERGLVARVIA